MVSLRSRQLCTWMIMWVYTVVIHRRLCYSSIVFKADILTSDVSFCNSEISTYLFFILREPLVAEDPCALGTDTQSHLMVHRYTYRDRMAHYDNFWNKSSKYLSGEITLRFRSSHIEAVVWRYNIPLIIIRQSLVWDPVIGAFSFSYSITDCGKIKVSFSITPYRKQHQEISLDFMSSLRP